MLNEYNCGTNVELEHKKIRWLRSPQLLQQFPTSYSNVEIVVSVGGVQGLGQEEVPNNTAEIMVMQASQGFLSHWGQLCRPLARFERSADPFTSLPDTVESPIFHKQALLFVRKEVVLCTV